MAAITQHPVWRHTERSTSSMIASIDAYISHYTSLPEEEKSRAKAICDSITMPEFVFSVASIEGEGLPSLDDTKAALLQILSTDVTAMEHTHQDKHALSTINLCVATKIMLARDARTPPKVDTAFIRTLHEALYSNTPEWHEGGNYRKHSAWTRTQQGEVHSYRNYRKIPAVLNELVQRTNKSMEDIFAAREEYNRVNSLLKVAGSFFLEFEEIHPFHDGNGRVGRVLLAYLLQSITPFGPNTLCIDMGDPSDHDPPTFVDRSAYLSCFDEDNRARDITALIVEGVFVGWSRYFSRLGIPSPVCADK